MAEGLWVPQGSKVGGTSGGGRGGDWSPGSQLAPVQPDSPSSSHGGRSEETHSGTRLCLATPLGRMKPLRLRAVMVRSPGSGTDQKEPGTTDPSTRGSCSHFLFGLPCVDTRISDFPKKWEFLFF